MYTAFPSPARPTTPFFFYDIYETLAQSLCARFGRTVGPNNTIIGLSGLLKNSSFFFFPQNFLHEHIRVVLPTSSPANGFVCTHPSGNVATTTTAGISFSMATYDINQTANNIYLRQLCFLFVFIFFFNILSHTWPDPLTMCGTRLGK